MFKIPKMLKCKFIKYKKPLNLMPNTYKSLNILVVVHVKN